MEWPLASPRAPMTFPTVATSPATMTYCPCVIAQCTHPHHPQRAPALCSRGHTLQPALTTCQYPGNLKPSFNQRPSFCLRVFDLDAQMLRWTDSHSSSGRCSLWLPHSQYFCGPERGRGEKTVPHTSDHSPILFSYRSDHSNCCPSSLWTSWSGTVVSALRVAYMDWVERLFTGRELSPLSFLAHDKGLLFKCSQVFIISPK